MGQLKHVAIKHLVVWTDNPRVASEDAIEESIAIQILIDEVGLAKMKELARDIFEYGLNSHRQPVVVSNGNGIYNVYDGNRRIAVMKCVLDGDVRFKQIKNEIELTPETELLVYDTDSKEALRLIENEHSGESGGKGQIPWDAFQRDYAYVQNGKKPFYHYAYHVSKICGLNKKSHFSKIPYTDLNTIFSNEIVKKIFSVEGDWDFNNKEFIEEAYERICAAKPVGVSYSRYLPRLKTDEAINSFQLKLFPVNATENQPEHIYMQDDVTIVTEKKDSTPLANAEGEVANVALKEVSGKSERAGGLGRNTYRPSTSILFQWQKSGISIGDAIFGPTLRFAIGLQINTDSEQRRIAPYLYRVLLEMALRHWCNWYRSNGTKFNTNSLTDSQTIKDNLLGTTNQSVSFINPTKLTNAMTVLESIKGTKNSDIRNLFKNRSMDDYGKMIDELNEVIHGSKEYIDNAVLVKYDTMVLSCLVALSISMTDN
ncbi:MAG: ParB/Srx family N-terminal domain-containing protein [Oscillospiraceae bacterium]|nr:ParB/Srx family N-terminal domain-containing protein [Oscillospiraceae bacterium]